MNPKFLNSLLGRRSRLEALRCLYAEPEELPGREIARRTGLSHLAVHQALRELVQEGVVRRRSVPPTHLFKLESQHWVVSDILAPMFRKEEAWSESLQRVLKQGIPGSVISLILFGSAVAGKLKPGSDIDLLALAARDKDKEAVEASFHAKGRRVYTGFGHPLSVLVIPLDEFLTRYRRGERFAKEIGYSGRVIHGKLLTELLFEHDAKGH